MPAPVNGLKAALREGRVQRGLWLTLASPAAAEIAGHAGFDWCVIDAEHGPNSLDTIAAQVRALAGTPAHAVVRVPAAEDWIVKPVLDLGVQTMIVPLIHDAEAALRAAASMRYPPAGIRGMGASVARASGHGRIADYAATANDEVCLIVQAESAAAVENIDAIAAVEGVDGVFVGPADLSADLGHPGEMRHPEVLEAASHIIARTRAAGKAAGAIWFEPGHVAAAVEDGVTFIGVGAEAMVLQLALARLA